METTKRGGEDSGEDVQPMYGRVDGRTEVSRPALLEVELIDVSQMRWRDPMRALCERIDQVIVLVNELARRENERQERE